METEIQSLPLLDQQVAAGLRGDFARGWQIAEQLRLKTPDCPRARFNRAWYEMMQGRLLDGLISLDSGRFAGAFGDKPLPTDRPIYRNENLHNKHLLLCGEGGLGDEIINVRFAADFAARGAKVIVTCDPSLKSIFARVPGVVAVVGHRRAPEVHHDFWVPAMSAARVLEYEYDDLTGAPYLTAQPEAIKKWQPVIQRTFPEGTKKIGLRFYGNPKFEHEQHRKFSRAGLIASLDGRPWLNLQKEESPLQIDTWEDSLAIISQLDLVITSCTSVAHASAALGVPTWILVPIMPYYLWALPGERAHWYKSVRLFRQRQYGHWDPVFKSIAENLNRLAHSQ